MDLIYAQSRLLYDIRPNALRSSFYPKIKPGPHTNGIVGFASAKPTDSVEKQVGQLSINQSTSGQATASSQPTEMVSVLSVQSSDQQSGRNRKNGKNNHKGGNKNENATNNAKNGKNAGGDKQAKRKVKFPCKLCKDDHLTYLCPRIDIIGILGSKMGLLRKIIK